MNNSMQKEKQKQYADYVKQITPTHSLPMNMATAFVTGGLICALGIYQPLIDFAGAGASVPLLGFGNTLWKGLKEAIDKDGFIGLFTGGFTACAAGVAAALIFSYLASWVFKPKMKE